MKFGWFEITLIVIATIVLTLIALWIREEVLDWWETRHHREEDRRVNGRGRRRRD
jgi:hypothetical protein